MRRSLLALVLSGGSLLAASAAQAQTIFADNFNADTPALAVSTSFPNWTVTSGNVDIIGSGAGGTLFDLYPGNGYYVDVDGDQTGAITTTSSFLLSPGTTYIFSFDLGKNGALPESMTVSLSSAFNETFSDGAGGISSFIPVSRTITVASPTNVNISFASNTPGRAGYIIDNVSLVVQQGAAAPEPASLALVGVAGLVAFGVRRRRA